MKKKGFTLIELLAVIVILAVIALIATPAVLNIIEDSKKAAAEASARNIASTAKTYYMQKIMEGESISDIDLSGDTLTYDGDKATKGNLTYDANGNITGKMYISGYCIEIKSDGTTTSTKMDESKCSTTIEDMDLRCGGVWLRRKPFPQTSNRLSFANDRLACCAYPLYRKDKSIRRWL